MLDLAGAAARDIAIRGFSPPLVSRETPLKRFFDGPSVEDFAARRGTTRNEALSTFGLAGRQRLPALKRRGAITSLDIQQDVFPTRSTFHVKQVKGALEICACLPGVDPSPGLRDIQE
ncbi:hypothetical protein GCM10009589_26140 [Arthrobacter pascens]